MAGVEDSERLSKMIRRGVALKSLYLRFPCRFTAWLLIRQVRKIDRLVPPPPSHVAETFGRLRFEDKHPVAKAHEARLAREAKEAEQAEINRRCFEKLEILANLSARQDSGSDPLAGLRRLPRHGRPSGAEK